MKSGHAFLRSLGVVGMNDRNINLVGRLNPREFFPLVDNKLKTKILARDHNIPVPALIGALKSQHDLKSLPSLLEGHAGFAIKPAKGSGGKGILVIVDREGDNFLKASGKSITLADIHHHTSNVLSGLFSLGGSPDTAVLETLIHPDPMFKDLSVEGVPDIRIIVYRGFPIMAMMRLSTRVSDGKANLHQGAVGVGLSLRDGKFVSAIQFDRPVHTHPDSGADLRAIKIPDWQDLLNSAARCADACRLGYLGVDMVLDRNQGPLLLELNARPGLAIQIANNAGMAPRLDLIDNLAPPKFYDSSSKRVSTAMEIIG